MEQIHIFISYCHTNAVWLKEWEDGAKTVPNPKCLLKQWEQELCKELVSFRYDREERRDPDGGDLRQKRIFEAIDRSDIAILLVTLDFVASPFIMDEELPRIKEIV